jgi:hypothetical protein
MQDIKQDEPGTTGQATWNPNYRVPLPPPSTRHPHNSYDQQSAPLSAPLVLLYNGAPRENAYHPANVPQNDLQPLRRGSEHISPAVGSKLNPSLTSHRSYPSLKRPYDYDDGGHYTGVAPVMHHDGLGELDGSPKPTIQSDHRLLSFSPLPSKVAALDQYGAPARIDVSAQIHGMFFLSEMAAHAGDGMILQPELTCYRRNLFQISGSVACPAGAMSVISESGQTLPVVSQELSVSALETVDNHAIRLIVIPWKTPPPNTPELPTGAEQEPAPILLKFDGPENQEKSAGTVMQQIAWRRLQFRVATANNGRRKELQQHFVLRLKFMATLSDDSKVCLHEVTTAPIVVRGRSPRNFQARKEIPLVGSSASPRGPNSQVSPVQKKVLSGGTEKPYGTPGSRPPPLDLHKRSYQFDSSSFPASPVNLRNGYVNNNRLVDVDSEFAKHFSSYPSQWGPPTNPGSGSSTPSFPPPSGSGSSQPMSYMSGIGQPQGLQDSSLSGPSTLNPQTLPPSSSSLDMPSRQSFYGQGHSYNPNASSSFAPPPLGIYDSNPRPTKSPRNVISPELSGGSGGMYSAYGAGYSQNIPNPSQKMYYPSNPAPPEHWNTSETSSTGYSSSLQHGSQAQSGAPMLQPLSRPQSQQPGAGPYNYQTSDPYTTGPRDNSQYQWNPPPGQ